MLDRTSRDWSSIVLVIFLQLLPIVAVALNSIATEWAGTVLPVGYTSALDLDSSPIPAFYHGDRQFAVYRDRFDHRHAARLRAGDPCRALLLSDARPLAGRPRDRALCGAEHRARVRSASALCRQLRHRADRHAVDPDLRLCSARRLVLLHSDQEQSARHAGLARFSRPADLVGASDLAIMRRIVLPCITQGLIVGFVMNFTLAISDFVYANLLVGGLFPTLQIFMDVLQRRQRPPDEHRDHRLFRRRPGRRPSIVICGDRSGRGLA